MPRDDLQDEMLLCPGCGAENFPFATFCITCGRPLGPGPGADEVDSDNVEGALAREESSPTASRRTFRLVETAAGLLMLALIVGYALYHWGVSTAQSDAYRSGTAAAQSKDWDRAQASFARAGDLLDAPLREAEAKKQVDNRNRLYSAALQAEASRDWETAIADLKSVEDIQPSYLDAQQRLQRISRQVFGSGLAGLVYLVQNRPTAGLFIVDAQGASTQLPGSDDNSRIRAISPDGKSFVYDIPSLKGDGFTPLNSVPASEFQLGGPSNPVRIPVLVRLDPGGRMRSLTLSNLQVDGPGNGSGIFAPHGLWWFKTEQGRSVVDYQPISDSGGPLAAGPTARVGDPNSNRSVVALDSAQGRVVYAQLYDQTTSGYWESQLLLADATGQGAYPLQSMAGRISDASVSSDGRWLLYQTSENMASNARTVWALPLPGANQGSAPVTDARLLDGTMWTAAQKGAYLSVALLPSTDGHTRVVANHHNATMQSLSVYDLDSDRTNRLWTSRGLNGKMQVNLDGVGVSGDGKYLAFVDAQGGQPKLDVLATQSDIAFYGSSPPGAAGQDVGVQFTPGGEYALVSVPQNDNIAQGGSQLIYAMRLQNGQPGDSKLLATAVSPSGENLPTTALPNAAPLLIYMGPGGELRATLLNGSEDKFVASDVDAVWCLQCERAQPLGK